MCAVFMQEHRHTFPYFIFLYEYVSRVLVRRIIWQITIAKYLEAFMHAEPD